MRSSPLTTAWLYVHLHAEEQKIRAEHSGVLDQPCQDSCLEFFISAAAHDARYLNIELNPNLCLYFGFGTGREDRMRILLPGGAAALNAACARTAGGWDVTYELPFRLLRLFFPEFVPSGTIRGGFLQMRRSDGAGALSRVEPRRRRPPRFPSPGVLRRIAFF